MYQPATWETDLLAGAQLLTVLFLSVILAILFPPRAIFCIQPISLLFVLGLFGLMALLEIFLRTNPTLAGGL